MAPMLQEKPTSNGPDDPSARHTIGIAHVIPSSSQIFCTNIPTKNENGFFPLLKIYEIDASMAAH